MIRYGVIVVLSALALAACGSSHSGSGATGATSPTPTVPTNTPAVTQARLQAAKCFRAHGINIPDFTPGGGRVRAVLRTIAGYPTAKVQSVTQACMGPLRQAFPNALGTNLTSSQLAQRRHAALAFAQCMRSHGISFPDPTTAAANPAAALNAINSLNTSSPAFQAASSICRAEALKAAG